MIKIEDGGGPAAISRLASLAACAALAIFAGSCMRAPAEPPAAIRTDAARYVLRPAAMGDTATIVASLTAPSDTTAYILHCNGAIGWGLQRQTDLGWENAWVAETNGCFSPPIVVPAGGEHTERLGLVSRALDPPLAGPVHSDIPPGTYRVVWFGVLGGFDPDRPPYGPELALERRVSPPITIVRQE